MDDVVVVVVVVEPVVVVVEPVVVVVEPVVVVVEPVVMVEEPEVVVEEPEVVVEEPVVVVEEPEDDVEVEVEVEVEVVDDVEVVLVEVEDVVGGGTKPATEVVSCALLFVSLMSFSARTWAELTRVGAAEELTLTSISTATFDSTPTTPKLQKTTPGNDSKHLP